MESLVSFKSEFLYFAEVRAGMYGSGMGERGGQRTTGRLLVLSAHHMGPGIKFSSSLAASIFTRKAISLALFVSFEAGSYVIRLTLKLVSS